MKIQKLSAHDCILQNMQNLNVVISESFHIVVLQKTIFTKYAYGWAWGQAWGQDGWILAKFFFYVFMNREEIEVHKQAKKEQA